MWSFRLYSESYNLFYGAGFFFLKTKHFARISVLKIKPNRSIRPVGPSIGDLSSPSVLSLNRELVTFQIQSSI